LRTRAYSQSEVVPAFLNWEQGEPPSDRQGDK
jgi:hypothetical protein